MVSKPLRTIFVECFKAGYSEPEWQADRYMLELAFGNREVQVANVHDRGIVVIQNHHPFDGYALIEFPPRRKNVRETYVPSSQALSLMLKLGELEFHTYESISEYLSIDRGDQAPWSFIQPKCVRCAAALGEMKRCKCVEVRIEIWSISLSHCKSEVTARMPWPTDTRRVIPLLKYWTVGSVQDVVNQGYIKRDDDNEWKCIDQIKNGYIQVLAFESEFFPSKTIILKRVD